jgi:hypothetical protein
MSAIARAILGLAMFLVVGALLMLLLVAPGTGEFVITVTSLALGVLLAALAVPLIRMDERRTFHKEEH